MNKPLTGAISTAGVQTICSKYQGIWLSPFEVEQAIIEHPAVLEAAVVPYRDDDDLEKPQAFVVLQSGKSETDASDIKNLCRTKLASGNTHGKLHSFLIYPKPQQGKFNDSSYVIRCDGLVRTRVFDD